MYIAVLLILSLAGSARGAEASGNASGSLTVNGKAVALHHCYARTVEKDGQTEILITSRAIDGGALATLRDGDIGALVDLVRRAELSAVDLHVGAANHVDTVTVYSKAFDGAFPISGPTFWYEPVPIGDGWIAGHSRSAQRDEVLGRTWQYDVTFFAPLGREAFVVPAAKQLEPRRKALQASDAKRKLPAGGGEEGAAYLAYRQSIAKGNGAALLPQLSESLKNEITATMHATAPLSRSAVESWAFMQRVTLQDVTKLEIVGGTRDADATTLELQKTGSDGKKRFGTARMVKEGGAFKVAAEAWRN
jgi:hypothetical protein